MSLLIDASARASQILAYTYETDANGPIPRRVWPRCQTAVGENPCAKAMAACTQNNQPLELSTRARRST